MSLGTTLKKPPVVIGIVVAIILVAWYIYSKMGKKYLDFGAMRYVIASGERAASDPLYNSVGFFVTEDPKLKARDLINITSSAENPGHAQGDLVVLEVVPEMRPGKAQGFWIATNGGWGWEFGETLGAVPGKWRKA